MWCNNVGNKGIQCILPWMQPPLSLSLYDYFLGDSIADIEPLPPNRATQIFDWLAAQPIFAWHRQHNFCEARAEAASLLLEHAGIKHAKCWVFGAAFLRNGYVGGLLNNWNYHVAVVVPVIEEEKEGIDWWILDPSTADKPVLMVEWAEAATAYAHSYHCIRHSYYFIFPDGKPYKKEWHKRNLRNYRWTIQGLAGIYSRNSIGRAKLAFCKKALSSYRQSLNKLIPQLTAAVPANAFPTYRNVNLCDLHQNYLT